VSDWTNHARRVASALSDEPFHPEVVGWLEANRGAPVGVACSGGADSLLLLLMAWSRLRKTHALMVLHFNHGVRGEAAAGDAAFVRAVADSLGLPLAMGEAGFRAGAAVSEEKLRSARLAFFADQGGRGVLLGHHANDVAETMVMRLCRGSGTSGLAAPQPVSQPRANGPAHLRPLLSFSRERIEAALTEAGVSWREDLTNRSLDFFRNRIRRTIWPNLVGASPTHALSGALRSRRLLEEDAAALDAWVDSLGVAFDGATLETDRLQGLPKAVWRRALTRWLARHGLLERLSADAVDGVLEAWFGGERLRVSAGPGQLIEGQGGGTLALVAPRSPQSWRAQGFAAEGRLALPNRRWVKASLMLLTAEQRDQVLAGRVNESVAAFLRWELDEAPSLVVRPWAPGDRFQPLGAPGSRKLQDCFVDRKIREPERKQLPVVCDHTGTILWVPGLPPHHDRRLSSGGNWALWLTYGRY